MKTTLGDALDNFENSVADLDDGAIKVLTVRQDGEPTFCVIGQMSETPQLVFCREEAARDLCRILLKSFDP